MNTLRRVVLSKSSKDDTCKIEILEWDLDKAADEDEGAECKGCLENLTPDDLKNLRELLEYIDA